MPVLTRFPHGSFCWPELCSGDANEANAFYQALFGWDIVEHHMPEGSYTMYMTGSAGNAAMYEMKPERAEAGVRPHWNLYIAVDDAAAIAEKCQALGGKVTMAPEDMGDGMIIGNLMDDSGVPFCISQNRDNGDPVRLFENGSFCWGELYTPDYGKAKAFYAGLFGWTPTPFAGGGGHPYTVFVPEGNPMGAGGMPELPEPVPGPPRWIPYFMVEDCPASAARAKGLGAKFMLEPEDVPGVGTIGILIDPEGAECALITPRPMEGQAQPQ